MTPFQPQIFVLFSIIINMQFSDELEFNTFSDAWKTPKTFYNATRERKVNISNNKKILLLIAPPPEDLQILNQSNII